MSKRASSRGRSGSVRRGTGRVGVRRGRGRELFTAEMAASRCFNDSEDAAAVPAVTSSSSPTTTTITTVSVSATASVTATTSTRSSISTASTSTISRGSESRKGSGRKASYTRLTLVSSSLAAIEQCVSDSEVPVGGKKARQGESLHLPGASGGAKKGQTGSEGEAILPQREEPVEEQQDWQQSDDDGASSQSWRPSPSSPASASEAAMSESEDDVPLHLDSSSSSPPPPPVAPEREEHDDQRSVTPPHPTPSPPSLPRASTSYSIFEKRAAGALTQRSREKGATTKTPVVPPPRPSSSGTQERMGLPLPSPGASTSAADDATNIQRPQLKSGSVVWNFFSTDPQAAYIAICSLCRQRVSRGTAKSHLGTTSQITHMKRYHKKVWEKAQVMRSASGRRGEVDRVPATLSAASPASSSESAPPGRGSTDEASMALPATMTTPISRLRPMPSQSGTSSGITMRQPTLFQSFESTQKFHRRHPKVLEMNARVAIMLAVDLLPFSFVENKGFLQLMHGAIPRWKVPSRSYFSRKAVPELYQHVRGVLGKQLDASFGLKVHLTTDMWTSGQSTDYMTVTAHWVSFGAVGAAGSGSRSTDARESEPCRRQATLCMQTFDKKSHQAKEVWAKLQSVIEEWLEARSLQPGMVCSDNAANLLAALKLGQLRHVPCLAHVLNLVVTHFLEHCSEVAATVAIARTICSHFSRSYKARNALQELQVLHNLPRHQLILEVATRWNSTYQMFQRLDEQRKAIMEYCVSHHKSLPDSCLTAGQWGVIEDLCRILAPFQEATLMVSRAGAGISESLPLIGLLEKTLCGMQSEYQRQQQQQHEEEEDNPLLPAESDQLVMVSDLLHRLRTDPRIMAMRGKQEYLLATFLDPRFKDTMADYMPGYEDGEEQCCSWLVEKVDCYLDAEESDLAEEQQDSTEGGHAASGSGGAAGGGGSRKKCTLDFGLLMTRSIGGGASNPSSSRRRRSGPTSSELVRAYLHDDYLPGSTSEDPLVYWNGKTTVWPPQLVRVAVDILSCPCASVLSERVFSAAGAIVTDKRTRLSPGNVGKLTFLKMNEHLIHQNYVLSRKASVLGHSGSSSTDEGVQRGDVAHPEEDSESQ